MRWASRGTSLADWHASPRSRVVRRDDFLLSFAHRMIRHRVLIDELTIQTRVAEMAKRISADLPYPRPILLGLLTGSFVFMADLVRQLSRSGIEPRIDFLKVSHYTAGTEAQNPVKVQSGPSCDLAGEAVLVVDDILDSGLSMAVVTEHLAGQNPAWLRICTLLDKPSRHEVSITIDYVGFEVPDVWLIGYGMDLGGEGRGLPYIGAVNEEDVPVHLPAHAATRDTT